jgi:hypothetical protein
MEFAVVLGRLIKEHPELNIYLHRSIQNVSWELGKLGFAFE